MKLVRDGSQSVIEGAVEQKAQACTVWNALSTFSLLTTRGTAATCAMTWNREVDFFRVASIVPGAHGRYPSPHRWRIKLEGAKVDSRHFSRVCVFFLFFLFPSDRAKCTYDWAFTTLEWQLGNRAGSFRQLVPPHAHCALIYLLRAHLAKVTHFPPALHGFVYM